MTRGELSYRRIRAPKGHGQALVDPPWEQLVSRIAAGPGDVPWSTYDFGGCSGYELSQSGRAALLDAAREYTLGYRDVVVPESPRAFLLTGHQPELFHPGVWFKNIALDALASQLGAVGIHVVIDNDLPHGLVVKCPTQFDARVVAARCPVDLMNPFVPYEERQVRDWHLYESFGRRLAELVRPFVKEPLVERLWPLAVEAARRCGRLGAAIAQARHCWEAHWGLQTLEIPLSRVCQLPAVRWLFACLFLHAEEFQGHYNAALQEYRQLHRIRGQTHPVADLSRETDWCEVPFWVWSVQFPQRRPLWCRSREKCVELSDRQRFRVCLPRGGNDLSAAVDALEEAERREVRIRPRALVTTLTLRMLLSDLFIHGIGGAKYDQLTDEIARRMWGFAPPPFATMTATVHLPADCPDGTEQDLTDTRVQLRQLMYHPERFLSEPLHERAKELVREKALWKRPVAPHQRRAQFEAMRRINEELQIYVRPMREALETKYQQLLSQQATCRVLASREYPFCLFPDDYLMATLKRLVALPAAVNESIARSVVPK